MDDSKRDRRLARLAVAIALLVTMVVSGMSLIGRMASVEFLTNLNPHGIPMRIVTAACFLLVAGALAHLQLGPASKRKTVVTGAIGIAVSAIGVVTLITYTVEFRTGTEWLGGHHTMVNWFLDQDTTRMAVITAMLFAVFGWVVFFLGGESPRSAAIGHALLLPVAALTYLVMVGYVFNIRSFYEWMSLGVALNTGIAFCGLCVAAVCLRPRTWLTKAFTGDEIGSIMARRLLPALLLLPLVIGWLRLQGERSGLFHSEVGVAIVVVTYTVCFLAMVWLSTMSVNRTDRARRSAEEARARLATIVEFSDDAILSKDLAGTVLTWNVGAERLFGYRAAEMIGHSISSILPTDRVAEEEGILKRLKAGDRIEHVETVRVAKDGRRIDVLVTSSPLKDHEGRVVGASKIVRDITDRKRAEEALRLSEAKFATAFANNPAAIAITRLQDGLFVEVNDTWLTMNGYNRQEVIGQSARELRIWPTAEAAARFIQELEANGSLRGWEQEFLRRNGETYVAQVSATVLTIHEEKTILSIMIDITERKRAEDALRDSEHRLRTILDALPVGVFLSDRDGNVVFTNPAVDQIWGHSTHVARDSYGEYKGRWRDSGLPVEPEQWALARTLETGKPFTNDPVELEGRDGSHKIIHNFALPIRDADGQLIGAVVVTEDVTQRVQAQEQLREAKEAAERAADELARSNRDLEQFAYVSSHDLQEPLRMVTGFMQLLHRNYGGKLDATADQYISYAVDEPKRMQQLINDLLSYSRVGSKAREPVPTDMGQVVQDALANLSISIEESKAQITVSELPTAPADGPQLVQVFQNLISNAIKFRGENPPIIEIAACPDGDTWLFSVKDNGIGFQEEFSDKIFMIFQRLHTKDKYPGTGIGLAVCKKIIDRHHGRIWVDSTPGQGSTFYFTLPA